MKKRKIILLTFCFVVMAALCFTGSADAAKGGGGCKDRDNDGYFQKAGCGTAVDCNDDDSAINPGAAEVCDGIDNNCDGTVDEGCGGCTDNDGDGFGVNGDPACPGGTDLDCDDNDSSVYPGAFTGICDGKDTNCDGIVDAIDRDDDGNGIPDCKVCNDTPASLLGPEVCDGYDNDCDDLIDEGDDLDGDGFDTTCGGDCDDNDADVNPGAAEVCNDNTDNNCDGDVDEGCSGCVPTASKERDCDCFDNTDNDCDGSIDSLDRDCKRETCDTCFDDDGDGWYTCGGDCDDTDPAINPGAPEVCNGIDDNCDGSLPIEEQDVDGDGVSICEGDCDDNNPDRSPNNTEGPFGDPTCGDSLDNDCDDLTDVSDPDCADPCIDNDADGYSPVGGSCGPVDCDDNNPNRSPGEQEGPFGDASCSDGFDNDCDELIDSGDQDCAYTCTDLDGDGYGNPGDPTCLNGSALDCNDTDPNINPGADDSDCNGVDDNCSGTPDDGYIVTPTNCGVGECASTGQLECLGGIEINSCIPGTPTIEGPLGSPTCSGGQDEDCDSLIDDADPGCQSTCLDEDADGYGYYGDASCPNPGVVDCNDIEPNINPGADDSNCNGIDEDCDGIPDDDYVPTVTNCGIGECASTGLHECVAGIIVDTCVPDAPGVEGPYGDLTCSDILDNDCDGAVDLSDNDCNPLDEDNDGDGFCDVGPCQNPANPGGDCDDFDPDKYPGAPLLCDGKDNDCDGLKDFLEDEDKDGDGVLWCAGDCDDNNPNRSPELQEGPFGSPECADGLDNDCDELIDAFDSDCDYSCTDLDGDGYGNPGDPACPNGSAEDCDDTDPLVYPGAPLLCDAKDNNCDGFQDFPTDEDKDNDGVTRCIHWQTGLSDCDDNNANRYPGNDELYGTPECSDGIDNDCDGIADPPEICSDLCADNDGDGYGHPGYPTCPNGAADDCDDTDPNIHPGADDSDCNGVDNNCSGTPDDGYVPTPTNCGVGECANTGQLECQGGVEVDTCVPGTPVIEGPMWHPSCSDSFDNDCDSFVDMADPGCLSSCLDEDGDGYGYYGDPSCPNPGIDCNDNDPNINPGADDSNCNGIDEDCDGIPDDDFVVVFNTCGMGECAVSWPCQCIDGIVICDCVPLAPGMEGPIGDPTCADALDNDCDDLIDAADPDCGAPCPDNDGDGATTCDGDCDDTDPTICPLCPLLCDGKDSNCDGHLDFPDDIDADGDGYPICAGDCDDNNPFVGGGPEGWQWSNPFGDPTCTDLMDNDCDGLADSNDPDCAFPDLPHNMISDCTVCHDPGTYVAGASLDNNKCLTCHDGITATMVMTHYSNNYLDPTTGLLLDLNCGECHNVMRPQVNLKHIRDVIRGIPVIFTAVTGPGSFADGFPPYDGICEVCHTQTMHHQVDGTAPGGQSHNDGTDCTSCHTHEEGFVFGVECFGPHDVQSCSTCHVAEPDYAAIIPDSACNQCHTATGSLKGSFPTAPDVETHQGNAYPFIIDCVECHTDHCNSNNLKLIRSTIAGSQIVFTAYSGPGSFADGPPYEENICNTCHTSTNHHQVDGTAPGGQEHQTGQDCSACHTHDPGLFFPTF